MRVCEGEYKVCVVREMCIQCVRVCRVLREVRGWV